MDELVKQVSQRTGLPADQAKAAVEAVIGVLKGMLPPAIAGQLDSLLGGSGGSSNPNDPLGGLGGMLGR